MKKFADRLLPVVILLVLLAGLARTCLLPKDINYYENRPANKLSRPTVETVMSGQFQTGTEDALNDQVLGAQFMKKVYNKVSNIILCTGLRPIFERSAGKYIYFRNMAFFNGHMTYLPKYLDATREALTAKAENYNAYMAAHPELDFYVYYIENDTDINFATGAKTGSYDYFIDLLTMDKARVDRLELNDIKTYQERFYVTDHHWDHRGSYEGYLGIAALLGLENTLTPGETVAMKGDFSGSKANTSGAAGLFTETFRAYRYDYPAMEVSVNGKPAADYGDQDAFFAGKEGVSYGAFYGSDNGKTVFDTGRPELGNILVLGESYDNAILKLLASHFNETHSVDLRHYERVMGEKFQLSQYAQAHGIDTVLLVGSTSFFTMDEFRLEG